MKHKQNEMNYKELITEFVKNLDYEIERKTDPIGFQYIVAQSLRGNITDDDRAEMRGYYKGLKVAKQILERTISYSRFCIDDCENCKNKEFCEQVWGEK